MANNSQIESCKIDIDLCNSKNTARFNEVKLAFVYLVATFIKSVYYFSVCSDHVFSLF